jgi:hypothetical protein
MDLEEIRWKHVDRLQTSDELKCSEFLDLLTKLWYYLLEKELYGVFFFVRLLALWPLLAYCASLG